MKTKVYIVFLVSLIAGCAHSGPVVFVDQKLANGSKIDTRIKHIASSSPKPLIIEKIEFANGKQYIELEQGDYSISVHFQYEKYSNTITVNACLENGNMYEVYTRKDKTQPTFFSPWKMSPMP